MYFNFIIVVNKIADLNINFKVNHTFQSLYNRENIRVDRSLLLVI